MSINTDHPSYLDYMKNELATLNFIANHPIIANNFRNLSSNAKATYGLYLGYKGRQLEGKDLDFGVDFDIQIEGKIGHLAIESIIKPKFNLASYVLSVCKKNKNSYSILRKFHFDYALPSPSDKNPKPVYHLQYGGELSPQLRTLGISIEALQPWLSSPRINFIPMNLALLFDMVFCEFRTPETQRLVNDTRWKEHIKHNEHFLLRPYYIKFNRFITTSHHSDFLIREYNYGR